MTTFKTETKNVKELTCKEFEQYFCDTFQLNEYSKPLADEIKSILIGLALQKRNAAVKFLGFIERHKAAVGTDDARTFIDIVKQIGSRLVVDERVLEVEKRKKDPKLSHVLGELDKKLTTVPIDELLDEDCIQDHIRLTGEHPTKRNILELFRFQSFCEPQDYVSVHMRRTRYRSPVNYAKALMKHLSSILSRVLVSN